VQSRAPSGPAARDKMADPIIVHPDVRRMLLSMKAMTEGGRAFACYVGQQLDLAKFAEDAQEQQRAATLVALLTPVAKAFFTDTGLDSCVLGQQVFGGHGYIREWGQEQLVRDVRICTDLRRHQRHTGAGLVRAKSGRQRRQRPASVYR
jgi:alkylation response protein AidB-like acyl-CoA dehydrogenase